MSASDTTAPFTARIALLNGATQFVDKHPFVQLLDASMAEHALHTLRLVAYIRDHRHGKGNTLLGFWALERLATTHARELVHNLALFVGVYGRFDDTAALIDSPVEKHALTVLARQLEADLAALQQSEQAASGTAAREPRISVCAKWIPSQQKHLERETQLNKKLSRLMKISPAQLRKVYLSPLRAKLQLLERFMCAKQWDAIDPDAVPSVAMQRLGKSKHALERHLGETFTTWKRARAKGKTTKQTDWKMPIHKIVAGYLKQPEGAEPDAFLEKQWDMVVEDARQIGGLCDTLVLPDVSIHNGSKRVAIALGLLVSSCSSTNAFQHGVLTFEPCPKLYTVEGEALCARVRSLSNAPTSSAADFAAALRVVLRVAVDAKLENHQMPAKLLVVSNSLLHYADHRFEANYEALEREFEDAGYDVPRLVYWNVGGQDEEAQTYTGHAKVTLVSGFSTAILRRVLAGKMTSPLDTMLAIVDDERYAAIALPPGRANTDGDARAPGQVVVVRCG